MSEVQGSVSIDIIPLVFQDAVHMCAAFCDKKTMKAAKIMSEKFGFSTAVETLNRARAMYDDAVMNLVSLANGFSEPSQKILVEELEDDLLKANGKISCYEEHETQFVGWRQPLKVSVKGSGFRKDVNVKFIRPSENSSHCVAWSRDDDGTISIFILKNPG